MVLAFRGITKQWGKVYFRDIKQSNKESRHRKLRGKLPGGTDCFTLVLPQGLGMERELRKHVQEE